MTHIPPKTLLEETDKVISDHAVFDCRYIGLGYHKFTGETEEYADFCKAYLPVAETIAKGGRL